MAFDRTVTVLRRPALGQLLILCLHLASLGLFIHGFLLTRVHLPQRARDPPPSANLTGGAPFDRVVWLMIDALRYDFVVADKRYTCASGSACHQGHMPFLSALAANQVGGGECGAGSHPLRCAGASSNCTAAATRAISDTSNHPLPSRSLAAGRRPLLFVCRRRTHHHDAAAGQPGHRRPALLLRRLQRLFRRRRG